MDNNKRIGVVLFLDSLGAKGVGDSKFDFTNKWENVRKEFLVLKKKSHRWIKLLEYPQRSCSKRLLSYMIFDAGFVIRRIYRSLNITNSTAYL